MAKPGGAKDQTGGAYEPGADPRLDFLFEYLTRSLKIKMDKWQKLVMSEDYRHVMINFFEIPEHLVSQMKDIVFGR